MKILSKNLRHGSIKAEVESLDDAWYLSHLIEPGNLVTSKTERKIKIGDESDRKKRVVKKTVFLTLEVEKIEFHKTSSVLRIGGKVVQGPEDVPSGSHHTFNVEEGTILEIKKESWPSYQLDKLKEASEKEGIKVLITCHDREEAYFGMLTRRGLDVISNMTGNVAKKGMDEVVTGNFYRQVAETILEYKEREEPDSIVVASPGFWKDYVVKELPEELGIVQSSCSTVGVRGLHEVVKRPELKKVLELDRTRKDAEMVETVMEAIAKEKACYGLDDCKEKISIGSVETLLVSDNYIVKTREDGKYKQVDSLMKQCEKMNGKVHIVSSEEQAAKLDSLGGIAGVMRWQA